VYTTGVTIAGYKPRRIIDEDGDGVEDNQKFDQYTLDKFRKMVYSPAVEDLHNTRNGELPGHVRWGEHAEPGTNPHAEADARDAAKKAEEEAQAKKAAAVMNKQFVQTTQENLSNWGMVLTSSEQMENYEMLQTGWALNKNKIYDADGDGVEDNIDFTSEELDAFYFPSAFNSAEDIYNTRHGNMPGHRQREFYEAQSEPASMDLVSRPW
jgi:hypothetical protein